MSQYQITSIFKNHEHSTLKNGAPCDILEFHANFVLVLSENSIALYKDKLSIADELGNGFYCSVDLPSGHSLMQDDKTGHYAMHYDAGFIRLAHDKALLVKPHCVEYYPSPMQALKGEGLICQLTFPDQTLFE